MNSIRLDKNQFDNELAEGNSLAIRLTFLLIDYEEANELPKEENVFDQLISKPNRRKSYAM